jgi:hypothetical protein
MLNHRLNLNSELILELCMSIKLKLLCLVGAGLLVATPALAVDLVGVHDLAAKNVILRVPTCCPRLVRQHSGHAATVKPRYRAWISLTRTSTIQAMGPICAKAFIARRTTNHWISPGARFPRRKRFTRSPTRTSCCAFPNGISWCSH